MKTLKILLIIVSIFLLDRITKVLVINKLTLGKSLSVIDGFFNITYVNNHGAAFGIMDGKVIFIVVVSVLIFAYLIYEIRKDSHSKLITTSISFVIGGLLGNLFDRVVYGHVIDFFDFNFFGYDFAIFNVGDAFIVIGTVLLAIGFLLEERNANKDK